MVTCFGWETDERILFRSRMKPQCILHLYILRNIYSAFSPLKYWV